MAGDHWSKGLPGAQTLRPTRMIAKSLLHWKKGQGRRRALPALGRTASGQLVPSALPMVFCPFDGDTDNQKSR